MDKITLKIEEQEEVILELKREKTVQNKNGSCAKLEAIHNEVEKIIGKDFQLLPIEWRNNGKNNEYENEINCFLIKTKNEISFGIILHKTREIVTFDKESGHHNEKLSKEFPNFFLASIELPSWGCDETINLLKI